MFENIVNKQQMIHMAAEVIILISVIIYFSQKNRKLSNQIEDLIQRVEEQENMIVKHEEIINKMAAYINATQQARITPASRNKQAPVVQAPVVQAPVVQAPVVQAPVVIETKELPVEHSLITEISIDQENKNELSENLDEELAEELQELTN